MVSMVVRVCEALVLVSLPEFLDFILFGKTILVVNDDF